MKKILKAIIKDKMKKQQTKDNLFIKDMISLDDKSNQKYFDNLSYQQYLTNWKNESGDSYEE